MSKSAKCCWNLLRWRSLLFLLLPQLVGQYANNVNSLQRVQNCLARLACHSSYRSPSQPLLKSLHWIWLPVIERVKYKLAAMTYKVQRHQQPSYLLKHIGHHQPVRSLRSSNSVLLTVQSTKTTIAARAHFVCADLKDIWCLCIVALTSSECMAPYINPPCDWLIDWSIDFL